MVKYYYLAILSIVVILLSTSRAKTPTTDISIQSITKDEVRFQTLLPSSFIGTIEGDLGSKKVNQCQVSAIEVGKLEDKTSIKAFQLMCGKAKITVRGVEFP